MTFVAFQAVLVLAHLANGRNARKEFHRNGDLIEKLKLFMVRFCFHVEGFLHLNHKIH